MEKVVERQEPKPYQCAFGIHKDDIVFHAHQPWADQIVYVPLGVLASCHHGIGHSIITSEGRKVLSTQMLMKMWSSSGGADAYIWVPAMEHIDPKQTTVSTLLKLLSDPKNQAEPLNEKVKHSMESISGGVRIGKEGSEYISGHFDRKAQWDLLKVHAQQYHLSLEVQPCLEKKKTLGL